VGVAKNDDKLTFKEQWEIVKQGFKKGVKYDGCTAVPDFDFGADCCGEHDYHYQVGDISRRDADARMRACIKKKGYIILPWVYWLGVRVFAGGVWERYRAQKELPLEEPK
jgi:hypothetical protein